LVIAISLSTSPWPSVPETMSAVRFNPETTGYFATSGQQFMLSI
jgi:hypothetical protein